MKQRTFFYWPTRILLAVGFVTTAVVILWTPLLIKVEPCFGCENPDLLGLPSNVVVAAVAATLAVLGLVWMIRIFRGSRDVPSAWRYRDH